MSLETQIAGLTTQAGQLLDLPQQIANTAAAQIALVANQFAANQAAMSPVFYVNQASGADTNPGSAAAPLRSIARAVQLAPAGSRVTVMLQADHVVGADIALNGHELVIRSDTTGTRRGLTFERFVNNATTPPSRSLRSVIFANGAGVVLWDLVVTVPPLDGTWGTLADGSTGNMFRAFGNVASAASVAIWNCELVFPATVFAPMFGNGPANLEVNATIITGGLNGKVHPAFTASGGTANTATAHRIRTNLPTI